MTERDAYIDALVLKGKVQAAEEARLDASGAYATAADAAEKVRNAAKSKAASAHRTADEKADSTYEAAVDAAKIGPAHAQIVLEDAEEALSEAQVALKDDYGVSVAFDKPAGGGRTVI